jgi:hypothetical protein
MDKNGEEYYIQPQTIKELLGKTEETEETRRKEPMPRDYRMI